jgi:hypothetical protein
MALGFGFPTEKVSLRSAAGALVLAFATAAAHAEQGFIKPGEEKWKISAGGIVNSFDTSLRLEGPTRGAREFDLEDVAGADRNKNSFWGAFSWRFASRHRVGAQVFSTKRENERTISEEIELEDQVVPVNTVLRTESKTTFVIANYQYSFIKNDRMEVAGLLGLYTAQFKFSFGATTPLVDIDKDLTAPLPVIGASIDYYLNPRWTISGYAQGFKLEVDNVDGRVVNAGISTDYMLTRHFGLGLGYNITDLRIDVEKSDFAGRIRWETDGLFAYGQLRF